MVLRVLGSSSKGNCYLLKDETQCLILDAGIPTKEVKKVLEFNISKIVGVLVTHVHGDHAKYAKEYEKMGIPVFKPYCNEERAARFGQFSVQAFQLRHDVPCFGFLIKYKAERLLYATDTEYIKYRFSNITHILIECNYSKALLDKAYHKGLKERVMISHMELDTCKDFVAANRNNLLRNVVLMHLSDANSDEALFKREVEQLVNCPVHIANTGKEIPLDLEPF